ncbi:MAG: hypothetical protein H0V60_05540 [Actinobacteria bacterium]|nr:hypothetical protein [Actinomycetota bacterium]
MPDDPSMGESKEELAEGWYLMSTSDLELELRRRRSPDGLVPPSHALRLSVRDALDYRNAGNLPDELGRTLRLVMHVNGPKDLSALSRKRLLYEPDYHSAPEWRRAGSTHVNVVPLRTEAALQPNPHAPPAPPALPWWEEPALAALETEWRERGTVAGLRVPGAYRSFVYKTVLTLRAASLPITPRSVADSIARWVPPGEADVIRSALIEANDEPTGHHELPG